MTQDDHSPESSNASDAIEASAENGESSTSRFSKIALAYNLGLAAIAASLLLTYAVRRGRRRKVHKVFSISDLLVLTLLLAAAFGWWRRLDARHTSEVEFSQRVLAAGGGCILEAWVPTFLQRRLPTTLVARLGKVREVRVEYPDAKLVEQIVGRTELQTVRLGGGDYDLRLLDPLASNRLASAFTPRRTIRSLMQRA